MLTGQWLVASRAKPAPWSALPMDIGMTALWIVRGRAMLPTSDGSPEAKAASLPPH